MIRLSLMLFIILSACRADPTIKIEQVQATSPSTTDTGSGTVVDVPDPPDTAEPVPDLGPTGVWTDCTGTITLTEDSYTWQGNSGTCSVSALTTFDDGTIVMPTNDFVSCTDPPWWLSIFGDGPPTFSIAVSGTRMTLIPQASVSHGRVAQFEERLDIEEWRLTSGAGNESVFRLCEADGAFFGGTYFSVDDSCDFLSCGGQINGVTVSDFGESWSTSCGGECPCAGVVTLSSRTEDTVEGSFYGTNCARIFEDTFTGVRNFR